MKNKKGYIKSIIVIIGVIIIPLLYSYFYLDAFWDPYSHLETLPVAIVNNDKGAKINDEDRNLGQEMCDKLKDDGSLKFVFTDEKDAKEGTEGTDYYAMVVIPEDFSKNISSASTTDKQKTTIQFSPNQKRNYLASQILGKAVLKIEESTRSSVSKEIVQNLADKLNEVPDKMTELQDGLDKLYDGTTKLTDGTDKLADGTTKFKDKLNEFGDGVSTAKDGSAKLADGANTLADGTKQFNDKLKLYKDGVSGAKDGSNKLANGVESLDGGIDKLLAGANALVTSTASIDQLTTGCQQLATGATALNQGIIQYTTGVDTLISTVSNTSTFLTTYVTKVNPSIMKDPVFAGFITKMADPSNAKNIQLLQGASTQLKEASKQIADGTALLSSKTTSLPKLKTALGQLQAGLTSAKAGSAKLEKGATALNDGLAKINDATAKLSTASTKIATGATSLSKGTETLNSGLGKINDATGKLSDASAKLANGASDLDEGANKINDGVKEAKDGVDDSITTTNGDLKALDGIADFAEEPVTVEETDMNAVPNYGTAFAPYFMSLSLWVGALLVFFGIYLDADGKFKILSRNSDKRVARSFIYLLIGLAQALVLALVVEYGLGLELSNKLLFYASCCLVSMVSISIVQMLLVHLKDIGKFLAIALLILQLTSCGGTFPMETVPKLFNVLYPYMPMTYFVGLFKQGISGVDSKAVAYNSGVLIAMLVVTMAITVILSAIKSKNPANQAMVEERA